MQFPPEGLPAASPPSAKTRVVRLFLVSLTLSHMLLPVLSQRAHAAFGEAGTAAMPAIAEVPAARPAGLAGAYTALGEGASALGVNPAGLARDTGMIYQGSVRPGLSRIGAVAWSFPATGGQWALSATYVDYDEILMTHENQAALGTVRPYNLYPAVTYARAFGDHVRVGAAFKLAHETLGAFAGSTPAYGAGFDAGLHYQAARNLSLGAAITNVGRQFTGYFEGDERRGALPAVVRAGAAYQPRGQRRLTLVADVDAPWHTAPSAALGAEYVVMPEWALRAGTRWSTEDVRNLIGVIDPNAGIEERGGEAVKLAAGTSVQVGAVAVDYAGQWWRELGIVHALTVTWAVRR